MLADRHKRIRLEGIQVWDCFEALCRVGDIYKSAPSNVRLVQAVGLQVDEYEFWPTDLAQNVELLCENGSDGEYDPATNTCLLTAGP